MGKKSHKVVVYVDSHPTETADAPPMLALHDACWPVPEVRPGVKRYRLEFSIPANLRPVDGEIVPEVFPCWVSPDDDKKPGGPKYTVEGL